MSLSLTIKINGEQIGYVEITRVHEHIANGPDPDSVNEYRWGYNRGGLDWAISHVTHRYGDGAVALAAKVLGEIADRHAIAAESAGGVS